MVRTRHCRRDTRMRRHAGRSGSRRRTTGDANRVEFGKSLHPLPLSDLQCWALGSAPGRSMQRVTGPLLA